MKVYRIPLGNFMANCYIVETSRKNAAVIDPGGDYPKLKGLLEEHKLCVKKILLTHGHYDHFGAAAQAAAENDAEIFIHENDAPMLTSRTLSLADAIGNGEFNCAEKFTVIKDGDKITLDELEFEVIHTPGHTKGGLCYKCEDSLFTGDTLFKLSMGRTDFPGGSMGEIFDSLKKLSELDGDFNVYPGHNETSTLSFERKNNPYLKGNPYEDSI
ncbi:MBL fold metallo-hydrolase [Porcipelethomonas sp.]|uniref:MBL fold metallo-hydrolase n=1 Tax=Porcipelethomonas sp. TaxID=2981675 RepID=UPI003EFB13CA